MNFHFQAQVFRIVDVSAADLAHLMLPSVWYSALDFAWVYRLCVWIVDTRTFPRACCSSPGSLVNTVCVEQYLLPILLLLLAGPGQAAVTVIRPMNWLLPASALRVVCVERLSVFLPHSHPRGGCSSL